MKSGVYGGVVGASGKGSKAGRSVVMWGGEATLSVYRLDYGTARMMVDDRGGRVTVKRKTMMSDTKTVAEMGVNEYGNGEVSIWDKNGHRLATLK